MKKTYKLAITLIVALIAIMMVLGFVIKFAIDRRMGKAQATTQFFNDSITSLLDGFQENSDELFCLYYQTDKEFLQYDTRLSQIVSTRSSENFDESITHLQLYDKIVSFVDGSDSYFYITEQEEPFFNINTAIFTNVRFFEFKATVRTDNKETVLDGDLKLVVSDQGTALIIHHNDETYVLASNAFASFDWQQELQA